MVFLFPTAGRADDDLTLLTEDFPPLNYIQDGKVVGAAVDIVKAIQQKLNDNSPIKSVPWARGYHILNNNAGTMLFAIARSKEREGQFKWVGPIAKKKYALFAKAGAGIKLNKLEEAKKYYIGVQLGGVGMQQLQAMGFERLDTATRPERNLVKLLGGRFDLWYSSYATAYATADLLLILRDEIEPVLTVRTHPMYLAFNKDTPDAVIAKWQGALDALKKDGTMKTIFENNKWLDIYPDN